MSTIIVFIQNRKSFIAHVENVEIFSIDGKYHPQMKWRRHQMKNHLNMIVHIISVLLAQWQIKHFYSRLV